MASIPIPDNGQSGVRKEPGDLTQCRLDAGGYQVSFTFLRSDPSAEYLDVTIELAFPRQLSLTSVKSLPTFVSHRDLRRFAAYLEEHITELQKDSSRDAPLFVPLELGFQVQALAGEVSSVDDGEFTLRFLLHVGENPADGSRVYVGAETVINVVRVKEFLAALDAVLSESSLPSR